MSEPDSCNMAQVAAPHALPNNKPPNLQVGDELNSGAWGAVYNGELEGHPVAVRRIHKLLHQGRSEEERRKVFEDFREECEKLQAMSHPHVVGKWHGIGDLSFKSKECFSFARYLWTMRL